MTIIQILIVAVAAFFWGMVMRERGRAWFLLVASVLVIFWLQPALPMRGFDFLIPIGTLVITIFSWYITAHEEARRAGKNWVVIAVVAGIVLLLNLTRYFPAAQFLTASRPPQIEIYFAILFVSGLACLLLTRLAKFNRTLLSINIL